MVEERVEEYGCDLEHCRGDCDHCFDNKKCREEARKINMLGMTRKSNDKNDKNNL